jgi:hypothetical protein
MKNSSYTEVYSDSKTAVSWVNRGKSNLSARTRIQEYELFDTRTGVTVEVVEGQPEAVDIKRKEMGLGWRKTSKTPLFSFNNTFAEETKLCERMIDTIKQSGITVLLWNTKLWGDIPADYGRK